MYIYLVYVYLWVWGCSRQLNDIEARTGGLTRKMINLERAICKSSVWVIKKHICVGLCVMNVYLLCRYIMCIHLLRYTPGRIVNAIQFMRVMKICVYTFSHRHPWS